MLVTQDSLPESPTRKALLLCFLTQLIGIPALLLGIGLLIDAFTGSTQWATWTGALLVSNNAKMNAGIGLIVVALGVFQLPGSRRINSFFRLIRNQNHLEKLYRRPDVDNHERDLDQ